MLTEIGKHTSSYVPVTKNIWSIYYQLQKCKKVTVASHISKFNACRFTVCLVKERSTILTPQTVICRKLKSTSRSRSRTPRRRRRTPSPLKSTKIHIGKLTRNVVKEHIQEIFSVYGSVSTPGVVLSSVGTANTCVVLC